MIGFTANGVPFEGNKKHEPTDKKTDAEEMNFEALWEEALDVKSPSVKDAYSAYDRRRKR